VAVGKLKITIGPWRASGQWWEPAAWAPEDWDAETANGRVWRLLAETKPGITLSYGETAKRAGEPGAAQAAPPPSIRRGAGPRGRPGWATVVTCLSFPAPVGGRPFGTPRGTFTWRNTRSGSPSRSTSISHSGRDGPAALARGVREAAGVLDAAGQEPPELLAQFVAHWRAGADVVYGRRSSRRNDSWLKRTTASAFYRVLNRLSDTDIPADAGDFRLVSRRVLDALRSLRERQRFMKGLFAWVGYPQVAVDYERAPRIAGHTKFNYWRLWNFALEGITGFSTAPLRVGTYIGLASALVAFGYGVWNVSKTPAWGHPVAGWPTMMAVVLFLGGVQLMALGVIGEYLGRLFIESKQRPLYLVRDWRPGNAPTRVEQD